MSTELSHKLRRAGGGLAGLILLAVILLAANIIVGRARLRADLTEQKLYSLSEGTRNILRNLEEPVTLKLFFSRSSTELRANVKAYAGQVEDLLHEYRVAGGSQLTVEVLDPKPDSDVEEAAQSYGVTPQNVNMFGQAVYFGLVAIAGDNEGVIAALDPSTDSLLEYNVTRLIHRVTHPQKPVLGVMSSLPVLGAEAPGFNPMSPPPAAARPWLAFQEIQNDYDLRRLAADADSIPEDIEALILVHPKDLPAQTLYALDQFVLRGGRLLALLDPLSVADFESSEGSPFARPQAASNLSPLLDAWGIGFDPGMVVADMKAVSRLRGANGQTEESPVFLTLRQESVNKEDILTSQLGVLMLPFAGSFQDQTAGKRTVTPLISSSDMSGAVSAMSAQFGGAAINREFKPESTRRAMAIRVTGTFATAYPDGKPKPAPDAEKPEADADQPESDDAPALKEGKSTVILVADSDLIADRFCVEELNFFGARALQPLNDNINFFANAVEQVAGSSDLIGIRSRGEFFRPFDRVLALEEAARQRWQEKEKDLVAKLQETREQLGKLQSTKDEGQKFILSPEQKEAIARFRQTEIDIGRQLKDVRKNLRQDIERLGLKVKLANIVLVPALVGIGGVVYGLRRRRRF